MFIYPKDEYRDRFSKWAILLQWIGALAAVSHFFIDETSRVRLFVIGSLIFLVGLLFEVISRAHILFWFKVRNHPDLAYSWFKKNEAWRVIEGKPSADYKKEFPKQEWVGPFHLCVPALKGRAIAVFAYNKTYRQTIGDFLKLVQSVEN